MPISPLTISDLQKTTAHFDFLLTAPYVQIITIPHDARFCADCKEPFDDTVWQLGTTIHRPIKLDCGHKFGIQCLAHAVFASDFRNRCPVCRAQVIPDSFEKDPSQQSWKVVVLLLRTLTMFEGDDVGFNKEKALEVLQEELAKKRLMRPVPGKHMLRIMVLYVEFLGRFRGGIHPMGNADRVRAAEGRSQRLEELLEKSKEVQRLEDELRASRAQEEERVRGERESELRDVKRRLEKTRRELEVAREASKGAAGGFREARMSSALMMLAGMSYALLWTLFWTLLNEESRVLVTLVIFYMALVWLVYNLMRHY